MYMLIYICTCMHVCTHIYIYIYLCVCVCAYIYLLRISIYVSHLHDPLPSSLSFLTRNILYIQPFYIPLISQPQCPLSYSMSNHLSINHPQPGILHSTTLKYSNELIACTEECEHKMWRGGGQHCTHLGWMLHGHTLIEQCIHL